MDTTITIHNTDHNGALLAAPGGAAVSVDWALLREAAYQGEDAELRLAYARAYLWALVAETKRMRAAGVDGARGFHRRAIQEAEAWRRAETEGISGSHAVAELADMAREGLLRPGVVRVEREQEIQHVARRTGWVSEVIRELGGIHGADLLV